MPYDLPTPYSRRPPHDVEVISRVAQTITKADEAVADHQLRMWAARQLLDIDLRARAEATTAAIQLELKLLQDGLAQAAGNPLAQELLIRHLQDVNDANRRLIDGHLGS